VCAVKLAACILANLGGLLPAGQAADRLRYNRWQDIADMNRVVMYESVLGYIDFCQNRRLQLRGAWCQFVCNRAWVIPRRSHHLEDLRYVNYITVLLLTKYVQLKKSCPCMPSQ